MEDAGEIESSYALLGDANLAQMVLVTEEKSSLVKNLVNQNQDHATKIDLC